MAFQLTEEQQRIKNMVRECAENEVQPIAAEIDKNHRFPAETARRMGGLGLSGLGIPEEPGGVRGAAAPALTGRNAPWCPPASG